MKKKKKKKKIDIKVGGKGEERIELYDASK